MATTSAPRGGGFDRECPGAAAGVEQAQAGEVGGEPGEQRRAHAVTAGADGGADAADRGVGRQARPGFDGGAVEIGFELRAAGEVGGGEVWAPFISRIPAGRRSRGP